MPEGDGACVSQRNLDDLAWFDGDLCGHVVSWEASSKIKSGGMRGFVCGEYGTIIELLHSDDGGTDATPAWDFDLGCEICCSW